MDKYGIYWFLSLREVVCARVSRVLSESYLVGADWVKSSIFSWNSDSVHSLTACKHDSLRTVLYALVEHKLLVPATSSSVPY